MSKSWAGGSSANWRNVRQLVLRRDGYKCRAHSEGHCERSAAKPHQCSGTATTAHHIRGRSITGDDPKYIVAACQICNLAIGDPSRSPDPPLRRVTRW